MRLQIVFPLALLALPCNALLLLNGGGGLRSWQETWQKLSGKAVPELPSKQQRELVIEQLNLTANTEPRRFAVASLQVLPDLFTASIPVRFFKVGRRLERF
jgi:hypothetical protein